MDSLIYQFTKDIKFDALKHWAAFFDVDYEEPPIDDMYPEWEAELRTELAEAMIKISNS